MTAETFLGPAPNDLASRRRSSNIRSYTEAEKKREKGSLSLSLCCLLNTKTAGSVHDLTRWRCFYSLSLLFVVSERERERDLTPFNKEISLTALFPFELFHDARFHRQISDADSNEILERKPVHAVPPSHPHNQTGEIDRRFEINKKIFSPISFDTKCKTLHTVILAVRLTQKSPYLLVISDIFSRLKRKKAKVWCVFLCVCFC